MSTHDESITGLAVLLDVLTNELGRECSAEHLVRVGLRHAHAAEDHREELLRTLAASPAANERAAAHVALVETLGDDAAGLLSTPADALGQTLELLSRVLTRDVLLKLRARDARHR